MKALEHLQELDLKIDAVKKRKDGLPVALKALNDSFNKLNAVVESKKAAIAEQEKLQRQTQAALDLNKDRLARANSKLEGVHNSHEFQAANKEIDQLKKMNLSLDEQMKKSKADQEAAAKELEGLNAQFETVRKDRDQQQSALDAQAGQYDAEIGALRTERNQHVAKVDRRVLAQYDRVRGARGGLGLVPAVGGRCTGCNMMVPPQLYNEVQKALAVQACPSCHRILFIPEVAAPTA
jgi:hypothetical protein